MKKNLTEKKVKRKGLLLATLAIAIAAIMLLEVALPIFAYLFT